MQSQAILAALLVSTAASSAEIPSSSSDEYNAVYSIESIGGNMPLRTVVVKIVGEYFTSYRGLMFNCTSQDLSQTGFYSSADAALKELARITPSVSGYSELTDRAREKACDVDSSKVAGNSARPPKES